MGAPFLVERGIDPSEEGLGPALIMRLLLDLPLEGGYFRPLADQPTMAQALWTTVRELRMAGVKSNDLEAEAFESAAKHAELRALLGAYEQFLVDEQPRRHGRRVRRGDAAPRLVSDSAGGLLDRAARHVWTPLQRRLIDAMPGERIVPRALRDSRRDHPAPARPERQVERVAADARRNTAGVPAALASSLSTPSTRSTASTVAHAAPQCSRSSTPAAAKRRSRRSSAASSHRRAARPGRDRVRLRRARRAGLGEGAAHEWPVTLGPGIPAPSTRPGRALIGFCDWIETDFSAGHLRRLLQSGDMGIEEDDEGFTAGQAARTLARAEAGWGRATYALSLGLSRRATRRAPTIPTCRTTSARRRRRRRTLTARIADVDHAG